MRRRNVIGVREALVSAGFRPGPRQGERAAPDPFDQCRGFGFGRDIELPLQQGGKSLGLNERSFAAAMARTQAEQDAMPILPQGIVRDKPFGAYLERATRSCSPPWFERNRFSEHDCAEKIPKG